MGVVIDAITFDGLASNIAMVQSFGCKMDSSDVAAILSSGQELITSFENPADKEKTIQVFYDNAHMVKLIRNCLADWRNLRNWRGEVISWSYF